MNVLIENSWKDELKEEFNKEYFFQLRDFLIEEKSKHTIFPSGNQIFEAFNQTPFTKVKVVILGQDPYHGIGQAHGLSFSVPPGIAHPPSLKNIFKELCTDINVTYPKSGMLLPWAQQGVLLLNSTLTVRMGQAGSHQGKGWEIFTDKVIEILSKRKSNLVFILWGNYAISKSRLIDNQKHLIIKNVHPSPLSVHRGFFGSKPFSTTNNYLYSKDLKPINWNLS